MKGRFQETTMGAPRELKGLSVEELQAQRDQLRRLLKDSDEAYDRRFPPEDSSYADSISNDYDGDGIDYSAVMTSLQRINEELRRRSR